MLQAKWQEMTAHCEGLLQKKSNQQVKAVDPALLLCSAETSPGVVHSDMESSLQQKCRLVGAHAEEGDKN